MGQKLVASPQLAIASWKLAAQDQRKAEKTRQAELKQLIKKYDTNGSGQLEADQLKEFLKSLAEKNGQTVYDDEVKYIMDRYDKNAGGGIGSDEIAGAIFCFECHMRTKTKFDPLFDKYDTRKDGKLNKDELKKLLEELNQGVPVSDEDVDYVMKEADLLGSGSVERPELARAVALWYNLVDVRKSCCSIL